MLVNPGILQSVAFLGCRTDLGPEVYGGTAFYAVYPWKSEPNQGSGYFITTNHSLKQIADSGQHEALLRINRPSGGFETIETRISDWILHPSDSTVDLAVLPMELDSSVYGAIGWGLVQGQIAEPGARAYYGFDIGDEIFCVGLFRPRVGALSNIPIVRSGTIAAMAEEKVEALIGRDDRQMIDAFLIETRSIGGLSGSPVFFYFSGTTRYGISTARRAAYFLGIMQGHYDEESPVDDSIFSDGPRKINMGIGIVIPAAKVLQILERDDLATLRSMEEERYLKEREKPTEG